MKLIDLFENSITTNTMQFWHGGDLLASTPKRVRWEYGPGLYLTTNYQVAAKYAKGNRKLWLVTVEKGVNANDVPLPKDDAIQFIKYNFGKLKAKDLIPKLETDGWNVERFISFMTNELPNSKADELKQFILSCGVDYSTDNRTEGYSNTLLVLYNDRKIVAKRAITAKDTIKHDDLPESIKM